LIPSKEALARLERRSGGTASEGADRVSKGRHEVLKDARERVEWEKWESSRRKELEDAQEAERIAFAEIDWQDFVVVSTVEFTEGDEAGLVELPPPMSISEVENMTIAQKKMAAMIMEGREDEVAEDERERERGEEAEMEMDDDDDDDQMAGEQAKLEQERQRVVEIRTADSNAPMKIRKDYVPKCASVEMLEAEEKVECLPCGSEQRNAPSRPRRPTLPSETSRCQSKSSPSTSGSSCSIRAGRRISVKAKRTALLLICFPEVRAVACLRRLFRS
jgi:hypothetical protein